MAQPNVAREPSMEEILASIRRIIESNDPISDADSTEQQRQAAYLDSADDFDVVEELEESFLPQMAANDPGRPQLSETTLRPTLSSPAQGEPQEKAMSLADVAARVRAAAGRVPEPAVARVAQSATAIGAPAVSPASVFPSGEPVRYVPPQVEHETIEQHMHDQHPLPDALAQSHPAVEPVRAEERQVTTDSSARTLQRQSGEPVVSAPVAAVVPQPQQPPHAVPALAVSTEETLSLVSQETEAQVARSFGELADVFDGISRQSMEDMARDMLRPMLQEWLDDNLPRLVERLVREEIERVARGPRR